MEERKVKESVVKETNEMEIFFDANSGNEGFDRRTL